MAFSHGVLTLIILAKSGNFKHRCINKIMVKRDNMKATTVFKLLALTLVFVFIIGPTAATTIESQKSALISGYKMGPSTYANSINPDLNVFGNISVIKPNPVSDPYQTNLWQALPKSTTGLPGSDTFCSPCALKNATKTFNSVLTDNYKNYKYSSFYFGASAGAGAGSGGGCCG